MNKTTAIPSAHPARQQPALSDILVLLKYLNDFQEINWIRTNALLGRPFGDKGSCCELAVLVGLRALEPSESWQKLHRTGPLSAEVDHLLSTERHHKGDLGWTTSLGKELLEEMHAVTQNGYYLGWVTRHNLENIIHMASITHTMDEPEYHSTQDDSGTEDLIALLNEHSHARKSKEQKNMISRLAGYIN